MSGSSASLSFDIDSSQAQRAVSVLQTLVQQSQATLAATTQLKAGTVDLTQAYSQNAAELTRLADQTRVFGGTLGGLVTQLDALRGAISGSQTAFNAYSQMLNQAQGFAAQLNTSVEGIDRFVTRARQLGVATQDLATPLSRITEALKGQTAAGNQTMVMLTQMGANLTGISASRPDQALDKIRDSLKQIGDEALRLRAYQVIAPGATGQELLSFMRTPTVFDPIERQRQQRQQDVRATIDQQQVNTQRMEFEYQERQRELRALSSRFSLVPTELGRQGITGTGRFTTDAEQLRLLRDINRLAPADQRQYERYDYQIRNMGQQDAGIPGLARHLTQGTFGANYNEIEARFNQDREQQGYLRALLQSNWRGAQNLFNLYPRLPENVDQRENPYVTLQRRTEAAGMLGPLGQTRPQELLNIEQAQLQQRLPSTEQAYRRSFGEDATRQQGYDIQRLELAGRYNREPEQQGFDQAQIQQYLAGLTPGERTRAQFGLQQFQQLHPGVLPPVGPGMGLSAITGAGAATGTAAGRREDQTQEAAFQANLEANLSRAHQAQQREIEFQTGLAEAISKSQAAAEEFNTTWRAAKEVLDAGGTATQAAAAAQDALAARIAQRITQGRALVTQINLETEATNQRALDAQRFAHADPVTRQAYALATGIQVDMQGLIQRGQMADTPEERARYVGARQLAYGAQGALEAQQLRERGQSGMEGAQRVAQLTGQGVPLQQAQARVQLEKEFQDATAKATQELERALTLQGEGAAKALEEAENKLKEVTAAKQLSEEAQKQQGIYEAIANLQERARSLAEQTAVILSGTEAPPWLRSLTDQLGAALAPLLAASQAPGGGPAPATTGGGTKANISGIYGFVSGRETGGGIAGQGEDTNTRILDKRTGLPSSTASGFFQILDSTWRESAPKAGVDINMYPRALGAPPEIQARVASVIPLSAWKSSIPGVPGAADLLVQQHPQLRMNMLLGQAAAALGEPVLPMISVTQPGTAVTAAPAAPGGTGGTGGTGTAAAPAAVGPGALSREEYLEAIAILRVGPIKPGWRGKTDELITTLNAIGDSYRANLKASGARSAEDLKNRFDEEVRASNQRIGLAGRPGEQQRVQVLNPFLQPEQQGPDVERRTQQVIQGQREQQRNIEAATQQDIENTRRAQQAYTGTLEEQTEKLRALTAAQQAHDEALKAGPGIVNEATRAQQLLTQAREKDLLAAQAQLHAQLQAQQNRQQQQIGNIALGPFATDLDIDRAQRNMALAQQFAAHPGLEQSPIGQQAIRANQAQDAINEQTKAMQEYRDAAHQAASAVEQAFTSVIDRSQTAGQAIHNLGNALAQIALKTFVIKPFEKLMDQAFSSVFGGTPEPGSAGDTKGPGGSVFDIFGRLQRGEAGGGQATGGNVGQTVLNTAGGIISSATGSQGGGGNTTGGNTTGGTSTGGGDVNTGGGDVVNVGGAVNVAVNAATGGGMANNCCCGSGGGLLGGGKGGGANDNGPGLFGRIGNWIGDLFSTSTDGGKKNVAGGTTASGAGATSPDFFDRIGNWFGGLLGSNDNAAPGSTADIGNAIAQQTGLVTGANDNGAGGFSVANASSGLFDLGLQSPDFPGGLGSGTPADATYRDPGPSLGGAGGPTTSIGADNGLSLGGGPRISGSSDASGYDFTPAWQNAEAVGAAANRAGGGDTTARATADGGGGILGSAASGVGKLLSSGISGGSGGGGGGGSSSSGGGLLSRIFGHEGGFTGWLTDSILGQGMYKRGGLIGMVSRDLFGSGSGKGGAAGSGGTGGGGGGGTGGGTGGGGTGTSIPYVSPAERTVTGLRGPDQAGTGTIQQSSAFNKFGETDITTRGSGGLTAGPAGSGGASSSGGVVEGIAGDTGLPPGVSGWVDSGRWDVTGQGTGAGTGGLAAADQTSTDVSAGALSFGGGFGDAGLFDSFGGGEGDFGGGSQGSFGGGGDFADAGGGGGGGGDFGGGLDNTFGSLDGGGLYAMGGVPGVERFARGGSTRRRRGGGMTRRFANGGVNATGLANLRNTVVEAPTVFRFAGGGAMGMAGEGGSEAILPLRRDGSGRLGVSAGNFGGGGGGHTFHNHTWNISTPDAGSFMRTRGQIENNLNVSLTKSRNRNSP